MFYIRKYLLPVVVYSISGASFFSRNGSPRMGSGILQDLLISNKGKYILDLYNQPPYPFDRIFTTMYLGTYMDNNKQKTMRAALGMHNQFSTWPPQDCRGSGIQRILSTGSFNIPTQQVI